LCNRFTLRTQAAEIAKYFNTPGVVELQLALRFNVAPTQNILTIRNGEHGRKPAMMRWGLVPTWSKEFKTS
jgi:putative SOS response-associated peptidase YedK